MASYQTTYKMNQMNNPNATTANVHYNTSSLDQYGNNNQFYSINQTLMARNLNYSILYQEVEPDATLEDMHIFFVAFHKKSKRLETNEKLPEKINNERIDDLILVEEVEECDLE